MEVQIKAKGLPAAKTLRNHAARRIQGALGRFGHVVQSVSVRLSDINGPRGGADKLCRIVIQMKNRSLVVEELGDDMRRVIDRITERVQYNVSRQIDKLAAINRKLLPEPALVPVHA
ncbi:MAG: HPF/RaiA family ribosome-associated protein [Proteobacteria bacterium]|nr:HPF/RaiA family ribosome-associated protein [Pseudomonadota bacterium]